jgi:hypothetical protein
MLNQHRCDSCQQRKRDLKDAADDATARSGIIVFIAKETTISAAPMKPMISMFMKFRFRPKV